jgi:hypothetical protein
MVRGFKQVAQERDPPISRGADRRRIDRAEYFFIECALKEEESA